MKSNSSVSVLAIPAHVMFKVRKLRAFYELQDGDKCTITRAVELAVEAQLRIFGADDGKGK